MKEGFRIEQDTFGAVSIARARYWGVSTQRALEYFKIGEERVPRPLIRALALQKLAAARANTALSQIDRNLADAIILAAEEVVLGCWDAEFPLPVWQTGSATQTHMNMNEVLGNRANEILGSTRGSKSPVHPNDHVNLGQSSNDSVPTAMHVAIVLETKDRLLLDLEALRDTLAAKAEEFATMVKIGRTHMQDAVPMTLGQEFSGYAAQMAGAIRGIADALPRLHRIAQGGTAVGTGINAPAGFRDRFAGELSRLTGEPFLPAENSFEANASHDALVAFSGALNAAAAALMKIANDIRLLASGPRAGFAEITLPANEAGSSIMPGKVNPTQAEALGMVCAQVMGNNVTVTVAGSQGQLEINAYKPVIAYNVLQSIRLLGDAAKSFTEHCVRGITADVARLRELMERSLMLVTALAPRIGYDKASRIARHAHETGKTLKDAALELGFLTGEQFDAWVVPERMFGPELRGPAEPNEKERKP
jgi:fumarate hydratase, class II